MDVNVGGKARTLSFTWQFTLKTVYVLGIPLKLGELLQQVRADPGVKLSYSGKITVSSRAKACKLAPQVPSVQVSPSLPVVGNLPGVSVPGVQVPGVDVPGSTANPTSGSSAPPSTGTTAPGAAGSKPGSTTTKTTTTNPYGYDAPDCTGPCAVVPKGGGSGGQVGGASDVTLGDLGDAAAAPVAGSGTSGGDGDDAAAIAAGGNALGAGGDQIAVDRAFAGSGAGGGTVPGLPTSLTLAAIAALAGSSVLWFARRRLARG